MNINSLYHYVLPLLLTHFLLWKFMTTWSYNQKSLPLRHPIKWLIDSRCEEKQFLLIHSFWRGTILGSIWEKNIKTKTEVGRKRPSHHRGLYSNHHLASCRHLRYIKLFPHSHHLPWGSYGSANSTRGGLDASPMEIKCIKLCRYVIILWSSQLDCITIVSVVLPCGY